MEIDRCLKHYQERSVGTGDHMQRKGKSTFTKVKEEDKFSE